MPSFATRELGLPASTAYYSTAFSALVLTVFTPLMGMLSDRIGRKPVMLGCALGYVVLGYPLFLLPVMLHSAASLIVAQAISGLLLAMYAGPICAILSEMFPTRVRYSALSIGYGFAVTIFGGFAPFISTFLIHVTGSPVSPSMYVIFGAAISAVSLFLIKDPTNAPLD